MSPVCKLLPRSKATQRGRRLPSSSPPGMLPPVPQLHQPIAPQTPPTAHRAATANPRSATPGSSARKTTSALPRRDSSQCSSHRVSAGANNQTQRCSLDCVRISFFVSGLALRAFSFLRSSPGGFCEACAARVHVVYSTVSKYWGWSWLGSHAAQAY